MLKRHPHNFLTGSRARPSPGKARDPENQRFLVPALRKLAEAGFGFIIAFDADVATNPNVRAAERKLAKQLAKFNVPVRSITGAWPLPQ